MADHAGHTLHVAIEGEPLYDELMADLTVIGGLEIGDISFADYLGDRDSES